MACETPHMSIGEAVRCGCARPEDRELWESDIVSNPDLFYRHGPSAVTAYTSTSAAVTGPMARES
jgi:hypothetical protein